MKKVIILGAGTGGTVIANHLARTIPADEAAITVIDRNDVHLYQPGLLFIPFGGLSQKRITKSKSQFLPKRAEFIEAEVQRIAKDESALILKSGEKLTYDVLIVATGTRIVPSELEGLQGPEWHRTIFDFYTLDGALALRDFLGRWSGGTLVVHIKEMPIKCPVAPLEFAFLADSFFKKRGIRDQVTIKYVTPLPGAFTQPVAKKVLGHMLGDRGIELISDFEAEKVDSRNKILSSYDGRSVSYDLLVTVPTHMGDEIIQRSELGDELGFIATDPKTLQSKAQKNIFVIGDATDIHASKAGSVAHFEGVALAQNIRRFLRSEPLFEAYDGHTNCFIESGRGKGLLIDFSYEVEPLPGKFPLPKLGPFRLLKETRVNHWGKLLFRWIYWHVLLPARRIPFISSKFSRAGKFGLQP